MHFLFSLHRWLVRPAALLNYVINIFYNSRTSPSRSINLMPASARNEIQIGLVFVSSGPQSIRITMGQIKAMGQEKMMESFGSSN